MKWIRSLCSLKRFVRSNDTFVTDIILVLSWWASGPVCAAFSLCYSLWKDLSVSITQILFKSIFLVLTKMYSCSKKAICYFNKFMITLKLQMFALLSFHICIVYNVYWFVIFVVLYQFFRDIKPHCGSFCLLSVYNVLLQQCEDRIGILWLIWSQLKKAVKRIISYMSVSFFTSNTD